MDLPRGADQPRVQRAPAPDDVFVDRTGRSLRIFVEASAVGERPKLIKSLLRNGADIMKDPKDASIYLVDPETQAGLQFATVWGGDAGKVVLDIAWAKRSRAAGNALLGDQHWGGLEILPGDAARKIGLPEHPFPTPRSTPSMNGDGDAASMQDNASTRPPGFVPPLPSSQMNAAQLPQAPTDPSAPLVTIPAQLYTALLDLAKNQMTAQGFAMSQGGQAQVPSGFFTAPLSATPAHVALAVPSSAPRANPVQALQSGPATTHFSAANGESTGIPSTSSLATKDLKRKRVSGATQTRESTRPSSPMNLDVNASPSQSYVEGSSRHAGAIFKSETGRNLRMYIQVEIRNRSALVDAIKANGGELGTHIPDVDYVILHQQSSSFPGLLAQAEHAHKPAVKAKWIYDSIEQEALLDTDPYSFEGFKYKPKRGRPPGPWTPSLAGRTPPRKKEQKKVAKKAKADSPTSTRKDSKKAKRSPSPDSDWDNTLLRSPSPPTVSQEYVQGKNLFTQEEQEYYMKYVPVLLERDPTLGQRALAAKLAEKVPAHSIGSWSNIVSKKREELEKWRRTATRKYRERMAATKSESTDNAAPAEPGRSNPTSSISTSQPTPHAPTPLKDTQSDIDFMIDFFVHGGADNLEDEAVFAALTRQRPGRSAEGWQRFWEENGAQISEAVQQRAEEDAAGPSTS